MADALLAYVDELEIEAPAYDDRGDESDIARRERNERRIALREIDRLKVAGTYDAVRAAIAADMPKPENRMSEIARTAGNWDGLNNLAAGLRSPDPAQRARFRAFYEEQEIADKSPREIEALLAVLERAKRPKGRRAVSPPWRDYADELDAMRMALAADPDIGIVGAARQATAGAAGEHRARDLAKHYRDRMKLRK
jgi:hypothetical protein